MTQIKVIEDVSDDIYLLFHHLSTQIIFLLWINFQRRFSMFIWNYLKVETRGSSPGLNSNPSFLNFSKTVK